MYEFHLISTRERHPRCVPDGRASIGDGRHGSSAARREADGRGSGLKDAGAGSWSFGLRRSYVRKNPYDSASA